MILPSVCVSLFPCWFTCLIIRWMEIIIARDVSSHIKETCKQYTLIWGMGNEERQRERERRGVREDRLLEGKW